MHKHKTSALRAFSLGLPIAPIGYLPSGRAVFPIAGGAPDDDGDGDGKKDDLPAFKAPQSQADLDRIISDRLARDREKQAERYAGYDDYKAKAEEFDKAAEAARSEQEKAVDAARTEGEKAATERANARLVKAEARALAAQAGFRSLSDVNLADLSKVKVSEDGDVDSDAIKAELKRLSDADPWRIDDGKKPAPKPDKSQGGGSDAPSKADQGRAEARKRFGTPAGQQ